MAAVEKPLATLRRVSLADWAWWIGATALWPVWLLLVLGAQLVAFVGVEAARAPIYGALGIAVLVASILCAVGSWFLGGTTAVNGAPRGLWKVPAVYATLAVLGVVAVDAFQWSQGVPGPLPWPTPTTVGFVVFASIGVIAAVGAVAFRVGVRSAATQIAVAPRSPGAVAPPR
jgi:hypothetical protein